MLERATLAESDRSSRTKRIIIYVLSTATGIGRASAPRDTGSRGSLLKCMVVLIRSIADRRKPKRHERGASSVWSAPVTAGTVHYAPISAAVF